MLVMLIVSVPSGGTTIVHFRPKWLESRFCYLTEKSVICGDVDSLCSKCWHNHRPLPPQVAGEQGRAGADHRRADVEEGGHLAGA